MTGVTVRGDRARLASREEHDAWIEVTHLLVASGAVTNEDLVTRVGDGTSPGVELLDALRRWGAACTRLGAIAKVKP